MASGNTTAINEVVDPIAIEQFNQLKLAGKELRTELSALLQSAIDLNAALGGSTPASFAKNLAASTDATNKIIANNNKQIENEQAKAAKQEQILNKYLVMLSKQEAARQQAEAKQQQRDAKEIAAAEAKQAKLDAIAERKANAQFKDNPALNPYGLSNPQVTEEPTNPTARYEPIITGNENMAISATKSAEAIATENAALLQQQEVMDGLSAAYRANIELLLTLQIERAENAAAIKALTVEDAASGERMVFLTAEQLRLKTAIQQTNLTLSQQTKQLLAEDTSGAQMQARLDELRIAIGSLSEYELKNIEIGGVWIAEAEMLDIAIKQLRGSTGDMSKNVGDYTNAINKSSAGMGIADKVTNMLTRSFIKMAIQMVVITGVLAAITWVADLIKNMDIFTGRLDETIQKLNALKGALTGSEYTKAIENVVELTEDIKLAKEGYLDKKQVLNEYNKVLGSTIGYTDDLNKAESNIIKNADAYIKMTLYKAAAQLALQSAAKALAESQQIANQRAQDAVGDVDMGTDLVTTPEKHMAALKKMQAEAVADKKKEADLQLAIYRKFHDDAAKIAKKNKIDFFDGTADSKNKKTPKPKDYGNTDLLEANRIDIEEAKKRNKAIYLDDNYSHEARLVALGQYIAKSKELLDNSAKIVNADNNMRHQQRLNALKKLKNEELDIENERIAETERLNKEEVEKRKKALEAIITADKEHQQDQIEQLNQGATIAAQVLQNRRDKAINDKNLAYAKDKISEKEYNRDILAINDQYNIDRINQELTVQRTILAIQEGTRDVELAQAKGKGATPEELAKITSDANKGIAGTNNKIGSLTNDLGNAVAKQGEDNVKGDKQSAAEKRKDLQEALGYAVDVTKEIQDLLDKGYEAQIAHLNKIGEKIQENADIEKAAIDRSLDTQSNKARREEVLAAQTASKQKEIQQQIAKEKHKQAVADKVAAIAEIILNTAIGASKVVAQTGILGILTGVPAVIALGAFQLAKVAATPIPQFAKGTPTGGHKGGLAVIGEVGPERVTEPGKPAYYSPGVATMVSLPRGTVVEPYKMLPETPKWSSTRTDNSAVVDGLNRVERAVAGQKQGRARVQGWLNEQRQADAWNGYTNNRFK